MDPNRANLQTLFTALNAAFTRGLQRPSTAIDRIAMTVPSMNAESLYPWLQQMPSMRKWVGDRHIRHIASEMYRLVNEDYESTISVRRNDVEDNADGGVSIYAPVAEQLGFMANKLWPRLVFDKLKGGFTELGFDGQFFFDTDHPRLAPDGSLTTYANTDGGAGAPWFLISSSQPLKPIILQQRKLPELVAKTRPEDDNVFEQNAFLYGTHARGAAGFGLPQLAWGSKQTLDAASYAAARAALLAMKADNSDEPLGVVPDLLVVGPTLESAARKIVSNALATGGATNEWAGTADLLVAPELA